MATTTTAVCQKTTRLIVTGFGPFGGIPENPTTILVRELPHYLLKDDNDANGGEWKRQLAACIEDWIVLETSVEGACSALEGLKDKLLLQLDKTKNNNTNYIVLHMGVNAFGKGYHVEKCAYNNATFRIPDERGYQPSRIPITCSQHLKLDHRWDTTLPIESEVVPHMQQQFPNVMTKVSEDPGRFVCNYTYGYSLHTLQKQPQQTPTDEEQSQQTPQIQCLFLHIPSFKIVPKDIQMDYVAHFMKKLVTL